MRRSTVRIRETAPSLKAFPHSRRGEPASPGSRARKGAGPEESRGRRLQGESGAAAQAAESGKVADATLRPAWWVRLLSRLPFPVLYSISAFLGWLAYRVFPYRQHVVRENLTRAFPEFDEARLQDVMRAYYRGFAEVLVEIIKAATLSAD